MNWWVFYKLSIWLVIFDENCIFPRQNFFFWFQYKVNGGWSWFPKGLKPRHWLQNFLVLILITSVPFITYAVTHSVTSLYIRIFVIGACVLLEIGCLRYSFNFFFFLMNEIWRLIYMYIYLSYSTTTFYRVLASSFGVCYKRGRLSTITIAGREVSSVSGTVPMPTAASLPVQASLSDTASPRCSESETTGSCGTLQDTSTDISSSLSVKAIIEQT